MTNFPGMTGIALRPVITTVGGAAEAAFGFTVRLHELASLKLGFYQCYPEISTDTQYDTIIEITPLKMIAWGKYGEGKWPGEAIMRA